MLECWSDKPKHRPKFSTLRKQFDSIISAQHANMYIDLQTDESNLIYNSQLSKAELSDGSITLRSKKLSMISPVKNKPARSLSPSCSLFSNKSNDNESLNRVKKLLTIK